VKKTGLLNQPLSAMIAGLGHTDTVAVIDAGLSIPPNVQRIDLAVSPGLPGLLDVLRVMLDEMQISGAIVASELAEHSPQFYADLVRLLDDISLTAMPHEAFREQMRSARAAVRTGEFTPYANIILISEVIF
jgi:D-ribose pyranase